MVREGAAPAAPARSETAEPSAIEAAARQTREGIRMGFLRGGGPDRRAPNDAEPAPEPRARPSPGTGGPMELARAKRWRDRGARRAGMSGSGRSDTVAWGELQGVLRLALSLRELPQGS